MSAFNLPKARCLRHAEQFEAVFAFNRFTASESFVVLSKPNGLEHPRLGLIASKKAAPRAVDRNYFKRQVREVFRQNQHDLHEVDVVVKLRKVLRPTGATKIRAELLLLFLKLKKCRA